MKYLNTFLNEDQISPSPQGQEPTKLTKPVLSVLSVGSPRGTEKFQPAQTPSSATPATPPRPSSRGVPTRTLYHQAAQSLEGDYWAIDPFWLIDKHYELWIEIRN